jgi:hypothetical protein
MMEVGTRIYDLDYARVFKEVLSSLMKMRFDLKRVEAGKGQIEALWKGRGRDPDEKVEVLLTSTDYGIQVTMSSKTASPMAKVLSRSASIAVFFSTLDGLIGDHAVDVEHPDGYPSYYPGPGRKLASHELSPNVWYPISMALTEGLFLIAFGAPVIDSFIIDPLGLCFLIIGVLLIIAAALMGRGHMTAGGSIAIICGFLTLPLGLLGIFAGTWAFKIRDDKVPLIPDHSYILGGSG